MENIHVLLFACALLRGWRTQLRIPYIPFLPVFLSSFISFRIPWRHWFHHDHFYHSFIIELRHHSSFYRYIRYANHLFLSLSIIWSYLPSSFFIIVSLHQSSSLHRHRLSYLIVIVVGNFIVLVFIIFISVSSILLTSSLLA